MTSVILTDATDLRDKTAESYICLVGIFDLHFY